MSITKGNQSLGVIAVMQGPLSVILPFMQTAKPNSQIFFVMEKLKRRPFVIIVAVHSKIPKVQGNRNVKSELSV